MEDQTTLARVSQRSVCMVEESSNRTLIATYLSMFLVCLVRLLTTSTVSLHLPSLERLVVVNSLQE